MKDFPYWRGAIYNSKTQLELKAIGEDLAKFQKEETMLTEAELTELRKFYTDRLEKIEKEP